MPITTKAYAAIRLTDGKERIDLLNINCHPHFVESDAAMLDKRMPHWAHSNKFVRVSEVEIRECERGEDDCTCGHSRDWHLPEGCDHDDCDCESFNLKP